MTNDELQLLIAEGLPDCQAIAEGGDGRFALTVISDVFEGLSRVKCQQKVYAMVGEHIASGAIHALQIRTFTKEKWHLQNA